MKVTESHLNNLIRILACLMMISLLAPANGYGVTEPNGCNSDECADSQHEEQAEDDDSCDCHCCQIALDVISTLKVNLQESIAFFEPTETPIYPFRHRLERPPKTFLS